ncbi:MAG: hypothetical protein QOF89_6049 [Acidobacteriota bacterium]|nr:hypothetical protein [Acidobacteriota bacterium]
MNGIRSNALARASWLEDKTVPASSESYKLGVAGVSAEVILWSGEAIAASFYLHLASASGSGRETLGERLNDPGTRFLPCKVNDHVELLNLDWISYIRIAGSIPEVAQREQHGASRQQARIAMQSGYLLEGQFLCLLPSARARLSDLLNVSTERFLLFLAPAAALYVNRKSIVRIIP